MRDRVAAVDVADGVEPVVFRPGYTQAFVYGEGGGIQTDGLEPDAVTARFEACANEDGLAGEGLARGQCSVEPVRRLLEGRSAGAHEDLCALRRQSRGNSFPGLRFESRQQRRG
jgi:hypothetical protein